MRAGAGRGGPGRCRAVKVRGNSTRPGRAGVSRRQAKSVSNRAGARGCRAGVTAGVRVCHAVKLRGIRGRGALSSEGETPQGRGVRVALSS